MMSSQQVASVEMAPESQIFSFVLQTPWWIVSALLHVLIIALASLVSISFELPERDDPIILVTELLSPTREPIERPKLTVFDSMISNIDATAPSSDERCDVLVSPEMIVRNELADRFQTNDPDRPDTQSAFGDHNAHIFKREEGLDDFAGGGVSKIFNEILGSGGSDTWGDTGGAGIGTDTAGCYGQFGSRTGSGRKALVKRHGGTPAGEYSNDGGLGWLAFKQEPDGHWDAVKHGSRQKTDTAVTGLALLALVGAGHSERVGRYQDNVRRAVAWLKGKQQPSGLIYDPTDAGANRGIGYPHAIATLAMVEAAGMGRIKETRDAAQRAIDYATVEHQQGEGSDRLGWRYGARQAGDLSVTGWYVMAMKSAKIAGLHVDPAGFDGAIRFVASVEIRGGDTNDATHYAYQPGSERPTASHRLTAIGTLVRQYCGWPKEQTQRSVDWFINKGGVPKWGVNGESVDLYYWYYGSLCAFQQGGDIWKRWNEAMIRVLTENQCKSGNDAGTWPVVGAYSDEWGLVGQTALSALCLEVYYRYEKLKN